MPLSGDGMISQMKLPLHLQHAVLDEFIFEDR